jgi:hypothetical protein
VIASSVIGRAGSLSVSPPVSGVASTAPISPASRRSPRSRPRSETETETEAETEGETETEAEAEAETEAGGLPRWALASGASLCCDAAQNIV